ncbi:T9SS type A sorting domain-containing protein [Flavobacteriaceae bacterium]|nr:T9SS type A sorting domain-containing protein [Flavobacteriaceae bacterium]MDC3181476.1 T9SS type A sorting domain-containing protein [Flavobacteriaceae bacterium]|tara:strand:+ start:7629 stop:8801 length:1173 start_codon:yes stop_codon:yes gene_type:complete
MFYNVLNYPIQEPANRIQYLQTILDDYRPDIFMICELNNEEGADNILNIMKEINDDYERADFELNSSDNSIGNSNNFQNLIFFNSSKFTLEEQFIIPSIYRDFNHYRLKSTTNTEEIDSVFIEVLVGHLKASSGETNEQLRLTMVNDLLDYVNTMPSDSNIVFGGDLNVYTFNEPAFLELLDTSNNIVFADPANRLGNWHNNSSFIDMFTQSTRTQSGLGGASGGFDDRFDFVLTSSNMLTNSDIYYVDNSYEVYGNNANFNCYNQSINSSNCDGDDYNQIIRNALYNMSDHLPVTLELQLNETLNNKDVSDDIGFQIMGPNLISEQLNVKITTNQAQFLVIYNTLGQVVTTLKIDQLGVAIIDVSKLSSGIYYLTSKTNLSSILKFIIE